MPDKGIHATESWVSFISLASQALRPFDSQEAHHHPSRPGHQCDSSTEALDDPQAPDGAENIDRAENNLRCIAVAYASGGKDGRAEVKEEVGACELLPGLQRDAQDCAVKHARAREYLNPTKLSEALALLVNLRLDVRDLVVDAGRVGSEAR